MPRPKGLHHSGGKPRNANELTCPVCKGPLTRVPSDPSVQTQPTCSRPCADRLRTWLNTQEVRCCNPNCGKLNTFPKSRLTAGFATIFCNRDCYTEYRRANKVARRKPC